MPFNIAYDAPARLVSIRMSGFWDEATVEQFQKAIQHAVDSARQPTDLGGRVVLNLADFYVQSTAVTERLIALVGNIERRIGRFAIVSSGSALQRMQLDRIFPAGRMEVFASNDDALGWLDLAAT